MIRASNKQNIKMRTRKTLILSVTFNLIFILLIFLLAFQTQFHRLKKDQNLPEIRKAELIRLAEKALETNDVPVGSLVIYNGEIIGRGYNTVYRDGNICGHAEINALNNAINTMGIREFLLLDRSKLEVNSTYEPCEMCKGTMNHYRIKHISFMKDKSFGSWMKNHLNSLRYELNKRRMQGTSIQDSLFMLHPGFPGSS